MVFCGEVDPGEQDAWTVLHSAVGVVWIDHWQHNHIAGLADPLAEPT